MSGDDDGIVLVSEEEINAFKRGPATIYYRRVSSAKVNELQAKCRGKDGRLNLKQFHEMLMRFGIRGWSGIKPAFADSLPQQGEPDSARLTELVSRLPGAVIDDRDGQDGLITCMTAGVAAGEAALLGN